MNDVAVALGYRFAGVHCGIKAQPDRADLALIVSDRPATAAGAFTRNRVAAAPVLLCRERLPTPDARGVVVCSGNATACTGRRGLEDARRMADVAAAAVGGRGEDFLVCSTGVIGRPLPMPRVEDGIRAAARALVPGEDGLFGAAAAILTTDTRTKVSSRTLRVREGTVTVTGMAKGAAMIGPNMATMLAFVLTDAPAVPSHLAELAVQAASRTFNCISVEGHTSTNDSLILLANGAGPAVEPGEREVFDRAIVEVSGDLARAIVADAEGAAHRITVEVVGLRTEDEARRVAEAVANSPLVKTAVFGADPNWGRVVSAAGYAGVAFEETDLSMSMGEYLLYRRGVPLAFDANAVSAYLKQNRDVRLRLEFRLGTAEVTFWTSDLTYDYVRLNADYTT